MKAYILPKNPKDGLVDITQTIKKRVTQMPNTQDEPFDYSMGLKKIMDDFVTDQSASYSRAELDIILKRIGTEMRDLELYGEESPEFFLYDINDLLAANRYYSQLKTTIVHG